MEAYNELVDAQAWCARNGYTGFAQWYSEHLAFLAKRRSLPLGVQSEEEPEERPRGRW
jgi:hypothetical protein